MLKIACVGDNCIDDYEKLGKLFPGGNPVNVAVYAVREGLKASYTGAVGEDSHGAFMRKSLEEKGVDISRVRTLPGKTAVTKVDLVDEERVFGDYDEGVLADFVITEEDIDFFCTHDLLHTGLWGNAENDVARIRARGLPIAFDFATQLAGPIVDIALPHITYAFFSAEEESPALIEQMRQLRAKGPDIVVVTLGKNGSIATDGNAFFRFGIVETEVVDTMGAGDSYIAGFCKGLIEKKPIRTCMQMGSESAAVTLGYMGAW